MKRAIVVMLLLFLAACAPAGGEPIGSGGLTRYVDEEYRIVCYQAYSGNAALACASYDR
jgi:hypothetical protein